MSARLPDDIDRLLAWPGDAAPRAQSAVPSGRLAAELALALGEDAEALAEDIAGAAAYLDGRMSGAERDAFADRLARSSGARADLAAAAAFLDAVEQAPQSPPPHLAAQAKARFVSAAAELAPAPKGRRSWSFLSSRQLGWVAAAVAATVLIAPLAMLSTRTTTPFAPASSVASPPEAASPVAGGGGIGGVAALQAISAPPGTGVLLAPAVPMAPALLPQTVPQPIPPEVVAALKPLSQKATPAGRPDQGSIVSVSNACGPETLAAATPAEPSDRAAQERARAARDACVAAEALARRQAETVTAARQSDVEPFLADRAPAAAAAAARQGGMEPYQADRTPSATADAPAAQSHDPFP
jgi:hypothetical protein